MSQPGSSSTVGKGYNDPAWPASTTPSKPSTAAAAKPDRPPVSKTTRPASASPATRPTSAATKTASSAKTPPSRPGATAPSAGRTTATHPPKPTTPAKKDVGKPATPAAKKPPVTAARPSPAKASKPETPKAATPAKQDSAPKKPAAGSKAADGKPGRKPTATREVNASPRAAGTKPGAGKTATPASKKAVGSSTPMPVKRGPKASEGLLGIMAGAGSAIAAVAVAMVATESPAETAASPVALEVPPLLGDVPVATPTGLLDDIGDIPSATLLADDVPPVGPAAISAPLLGTTVLSPPSSPPGPALLLAQSPASLPDQRTPDPASPITSPESLAESTVKPPWEDLEHGQSSPAGGDAEPTNQRAETGAGPQLATPTEDLAHAGLHSLIQEREEAVEKADEEINEDDDDDEEEERVSVSEMSGTQPTDESRAGSACLAGGAWRAGTLLSEQDSEDVSGSQQGASELSAPGLLEGTESTDDLGDASLKGAEGDGASASSPDIETVPEIPANEDDEDEDEEEEEDRVYDMDVSSERAEDPRKSQREEEAEEEEDDEDVEMASEGVTESGLESYGNADEDDFAEEDRLDNLNRTPMGPPIPPAGPWAQSASPFADPWAPPPQLSPAHPISPLPDRWAVNPGMPTPPSQAWLDLGSGPLLPSHADEPLPRAASQPTPPARSPPPLPPPAVGMSQSSTLSGPELAPRSSSETSTPEELRDYDSSSGVESRSEDKQDTPAPRPPPDAEQDLGIHLERGDGEEEEEEAEAETLPADDVLGGPPTAPASATPSPSDSGDEAESDTEGEMRMNDDAAQGRGLTALEEREEAGELPAGEEEDGGTPQSANSAASYVFDITSTSNNSNAHSAAESCGRSPGIFSLENEDQLPEEAKDPSLIRELTLPAAAPVDLLPLDDQPGDAYAFCGKPGGGVEPLDPAQPAVGPLEAPEPQPPYYAICDKTDTFLAARAAALTGDCPVRLPLRSSRLLPRLVPPAPPTTSSSSAPRERRGSHGHRAASPSCSFSSVAVETPGGHCHSDTWTARHLALQEQERGPKRGPPPAPSQPRPVECRIDLPPPPGSSRPTPNSQLRRLEQHQLQLRRIQLRHELGRRRQEEERRRQEEERRRQEVERRRQEVERQLQKQKAASHRAPPSVQLFPSGLCTIYEAMETSEEEEEEGGARKRRGSTSVPNSPRGTLPRPVPCDLEWEGKADVLQQLVNRALLLAEEGYPPLLLLPGGVAGTLSPLQTSAWPPLLPPLALHTGTVTSVSSFSPEGLGGFPHGDWTVVELETHH
ncbi:hypothetical protein SKAU_G00304120 [Synaphobranchus kaupii]|uniref:BTB/POZ domain-containing protein n=1 Tax=Synaphobranchus kaupii TaxID=118154 RepID=A0A9Q1EWB8_SYNKA|nr:hypothetical protein SKAU_G00304120 [Synaphobranchus kaupii]